MTSLVNTLSLYLPTYGHNSVLSVKRPMEKNILTNGYSKNVTHPLSDLPELYMYMFLT